MSVRTSLQNPIATSRFFPPRVPSRTTRADAPCRQRGPRENGSVPSAYETRNPFHRPVPVRVKNKSFFSSNVRKNIDAISFLVSVLPAAAKKFRRFDVSVRNWRIGRVATLFRNLGFARSTVVCRRERNREWRLIFKNKKTRYRQNGIGRVYSVCFGPRVPMGYGTFL